MISNHHIKLISFYLSIIVSVVVLYFFNGTGQEADSINHYLYAKYAPIHPELYLNHWAKPLFTLLATPFAQYGFVGVKVFNVLCTLLSIYFAERIATKLNLKHSWLIAFFVFLMPLTYLVTFSGLTEPLAALILTLGIYLILDKKLTSAAILISFLPFVRSEGLILIGLIGFYFLANKQFKVLPYLLVGHLVYSLIGWHYYQDFLWVFTKIPYASLSSPYGSGSIFHFPVQLIYVTGLPLLILFCIGLIGLLYFNLRKKRWKSTPLLLIAFSFLAFFIAHALFWKFGIFNSMGLKRVLGCLIPIMAVICLYGFNYAFEWIKSKKIRNTIQALFLIYSFVFIFTSNPAAVDWQKDLNLNESQNLANQVSTWVNSEFNTLPLLVYSDPYLSESLNLDPFNPAVHSILDHAEKLKQPGIIIWDNWHSPTDWGIQLKDLESNKDLKLLRVFEKNSSKYVIFKSLKH
ncbi:MAG: hypothetical protein DWP98_04505 [Bacteroidetes bacterium]|nr:MAG: hypothetical protein DWP98_04505 [Bacteroidota bacterium]MBL1144681.1 hypothetical protein [Bacteroidota bacterium]NOG57475.1 hypothetical protein [Bacteroidota bacterium]